MGGAASNTGGYSFNHENARWSGFCGGFVGKPNGGKRLSDEQSKLLHELIKQLQDKYKTYDEFNKHRKEEREWIKKKLAECSPANR